MTIGDVAGRGMSLAEMERRIADGHPKDPYWFHEDMERMIAALRKVETERDQYKRLAALLDEGKCTAANPQTCEGCATCVRQVMEDQVRDAAKMLREHIANWPIEEHERRDVRAIMDATAFLDEEKAP